MPASTRAFFEPRFGAPLDRVRIHVDAQSAESAARLGARAYTVGTDIVFGRGQYAPDTAVGIRLLTHELVHATQQSQQRRPWVTTEEESPSAGLRRSIGIRRKRGSEPGELAERSPDAGKATFPGLADPGLAADALDVARRWAFLLVPHQSPAVQVSDPNDPAEKQAERAADAVMSSMSTAPEVDNPKRTAVPSDGGLDEGSRQRFEPFFGDLSAVRIHTDDTAAKDARTLNAHAFTIGAGIWFAAGKFAPESSDGQRLLAHELAHATSPAPDSAVAHRDLAGYTREHLDVEQSSFAGPDVGSTALFDVTSADAAAVSSALSALISAGKIGTATRGDMQRFWSTGATLAEVESAFSASSFPKAHEMATSLLDGTRIAVYSHNEKAYIPGLIWDTTLSETTQNVSVQTTRGLTNAERTAAQSVFGNSLNYDSITLDEAPVMAIGGYARTTPWTINVPPGTLYGGMSITWLIHEMGHSWQYAHGVSLATTLYHAIRGLYAYGGEAELARRTAAGQGLGSFNTEQQADIAKDAYLAINGRGTLTVYKPFIDEFHHGYR